MIQQSLFTAHVFFSGLVQGVGFRSYVKHRAQKNAVTGWVTNLRDGRVEAVFQAISKETIEKTIKECSSYFYGKVESKDVSWSNGEEEYKEFVIIK